MQILKWETVAMQIYLDKYGRKFYQNLSHKNQHTKKKCDRSYILEYFYLPDIFIVKNARVWCGYWYLLVIGWASRVLMVCSDGGRSVQNFCILSLPSTPFPFHIKVAVSMYILEINWKEKIIHIVDVHIYKQKYIWQYDHYLHISAYPEFHNIILWIPLQFDKLDQF